MNMWYFYVFFFFFLWRGACGLNQSRCTIHFSNAFKMAYRYFTHLSHLSIRSPSRIQVWKFPSLPSDYNDRKQNWSTCKQRYYKALGSRGANRGQEWGALSRRSAFVVPGFLCAWSQNDNLTCLGLRNCGDTQTMAGDSFWQPSEANLS